MLPTNVRCVLFVASIAGLVLLTVFSPSPACRASETEAADFELIEQLIESLGSDRFFVREWAHAELSKIGLDAFEALMEAELHEDVEVAARARYLLRSLPVEWTSNEDHPAVQRILLDYESLDEPERKQRIERLSLLEEGLALEALVCLVRFERSQVLSKRAALVLLEVLSADETSLSQWSQLTLRSLGQSRRTAAGWLTTYLAIQSDEGAEPSQWSELVREEESIWQRWPRQSHQEILLALLEHETFLLKRFGHLVEAKEAMRRMIALETGETESLCNLVRWLADRQAWSLVEETVRRFQARFENDPLLLYTLAAARRLQGETQEVEELVSRAQELEPENLSQHVAVARDLQSHGMLDWAESEFRFVIESAPTKSKMNMTAGARWLLAYMLHDRQDHLAAAQLLKEPVEELLKQSQGKLAGTKGRRQREQDWTARMHYYYACHWEIVGDHGEQLKHLESALDAAPLDVDVLISLYRLPDSEPDRQARTRSRIKQAIVLFRRQIEQIPGNVKLLNELAWLIANTEGDLDLALRCSQESLAMQPGSAGLLDTLAHCHFVRGELDEAVKYQKLAVKRESHSGQMRRQLERFERALEGSLRQRSTEDASTAP